MRLWRNRFHEYLLCRPWNIVLGIFSFWTALDYIGFSPVYRSPGVCVAGLVLCVLNCYAWALLLKPFQAVRPPAFAVRAGKICCFAGLLVWVASALLVIDVTVTPNKRWTLGDAELRREVYGGKPTQFAGTPVFRVRLKPTLFPIVIGGPCASFGYGSSFTQYWPTWGLAVSSVLPTLVLVYLRRERIRPNHCWKCDYCLTGNTSGRCPECGTLSKKKCPPSPT